MQKKLIIVMLFVVAVVCSMSCKKETLPLFSAGNSVYFANYDSTLNVYKDSTVIAFAFAKASVHDSLIKLRINVTGAPSAQDRPYIIIVDTGTTAIAGVHYEAFQQSFVLPAGKVFDSIAIKLLRAADLEQNTVRLVLAVQPNNYFTTNMSSAVGEFGVPLSHLRHTIRFSDILTKPDYWYEFMFGRFTKKKMDLVCELGNIDPAFLNNGDAGTPPGTRDFTTKLSYLSELLKQYLLAQKAAGTPVYYEDGVTEMVTNDF